MNNNYFSFNSGTFLQGFVFITLVICGSVQYFAGVSVILWLPVILALTMIALMVLQVRFEDFKLDQQEQILLVLVVGFLLLALSSTFLQHGLLVTIIGLKNEVGLMVVLICLILGFCRESQVNRIIKSFYFIFYVQFPVVLYQIFVIVPRRVAFSGEAESWDSVVGTFGGDPFGGGNTAALGLFALLIMLLKVSEYKHGITTLKSALLHVLGAFFICIVAEVKFVILLSPLLLVLLWISKSHLKGLKQYNIKMLLGMIAGLFFFISVAIFLLSLTYASAGETDPSKGALGIFLESIDYILDTDIILENGELGRFTTVFFWIQHADLNGIVGQLFGYGLNATNRGSAISPGFLNVTFNVFLDSTSLSVLLWEVGIIGTAMFMLIIAYSLKICRATPVFDRERLSEDDIRLVSYVPALSVFGLACLLTLPYSQILTVTPMLQLLCYFTLGANLIIRKSLMNAAK